MDGGGGRCRSALHSGRLVISRGRSGRISAGRVCNRRSGNSIGVGDLRKNGRGGHCGRRLICRRSRRLGWEGRAGICSRGR